MCRERIDSEASRDESERESYLERRWRASREKRRA